MIAMLLSGCIGNGGVTKAQNTVEQFMQAIIDKDINTISNLSASQIFLWNMYFVTHQVFVNDLWQRDLDNDYHRDLTYSIEQITQAGSDSIVELDTAFHITPYGVDVTQTWWFTINDKGLVIGYNLLNTW